MVRGSPMERQTQGNFVFQLEGAKVDGRGVSDKQNEHQRDFGDGCTSSELIFGW